MFLEWPDVKANLAPKWATLKKKIHLADSTPTVGQAYVDCTQREADNNYDLIDSMSEFKDDKLRHECLSGETSSHIPEGQFLELRHEGIRRKNAWKDSCSEFQAKAEGNVMVRERNYRLKSSAPDPGASCEESEPCPNVIQTGTVNARSPNSPPFQQRTSEWYKERGEYARRVPYKTSQKT